MKINSYVEVIGTGYTQACPDTIRIEIGVELSSSDNQRARSKIADNHYWILEVLRKAEIPSDCLSITRCSNRNRNYSAQGRHKGEDMHIDAGCDTDLGFMLDVPLKYDKVNNLMMLLGEYFPYSNIKTTFALHSGNNSYREALKLAVEDARSRAAVIAEAAGGQVGRMSSVTELRHECVPTSVCSTLPEENIDLSSNEKTPQTEPFIITVSVRAAFDIVYS